MKRIIILAGVAVIGAVAFLFFWPGEPDESDMLTALQHSAQFRTIMNIPALPGAASVEDVLKKAGIKKSGCVRTTDKPGYMCGFQLGDSPRLQGRFFKTLSGWAMEFG